MKMQGLSMWEMNLGFRPKDFQSVWGAIIQKNSPLAVQQAMGRSDSKARKNGRAGNTNLGATSFGF